MTCHWVENHEATSLCGPCSHGSIRMLKRERRAVFFVLDFEFGDAPADAGTGSCSNHVVSAFRCARTGRGDANAVFQAIRSLRLTTPSLDESAPMAILLHVRNWSFHRLFCNAAYSWPMTVYNRLYGKK